MSRNFAFGPLSVSIDDEDTIGGILVSEFDYLPTIDESPDIAFQFESGFVEPPDDGTWIDDRIWVRENRAFLDVRGGNPFGDKRYQIRIDGNPLVEPSEITIFYDHRLIRPAYQGIYTLVQQINWKYLNRRRIVADNVLYDVLEPLIHQRLLAKEHAFVHASAIGKNGNGVLFPGWGGTGKTSSCVQFVQNDGYSFLADDLAIISADGDMFPYTKLMQIYPYNLKGEERSETKVLEGRNLVDRLQWHTLKRVKGPKGVCRRVSPSRYFDDQEYDTQAMPLAKVLYLTREERDSIELSSPTPESLGRRAGSVIAHEFDAYGKFGRALHAAEPDIWPSVDDIVSESVSIYTDCFRDVPYSLCHIPRETTPAELATFLRSELL